jgi:hypothetical protein
MKPQTIDAYNGLQAADDRVICEMLRNEIDAGLPEAESKIWHAHPVWFLEGNPIVGYSKLKSGIRLFFWSGADFDEAELSPGTGTFRDASITFTSIDRIKPSDLRRWLGKAERIQWDYKNLVRKGKLERIE